MNTNGRRKKFVPKFHSSFKQCQYPICYIVKKYVHGESIMHFINNTRIIYETFPYSSVLIGMLYRLYMFIIS